jgi:hypothetical protein
MVENIGRVGFNYHFSRLRAVLLLGEFAHCGPAF